MVCSRASSASRRWVIRPICSSTSYSNTGGVHLLARQFHNDGRSRLTSLWVPSGKGANADPKQDDAHALMLKTGFLQQAYSGVFHLLPLGSRVQDKIERLVDKYMRGLGASKVSLSSITNAALWKQSGRLKGDTSELTEISTRAGEGYFLAPTHEEEITKIVGDAVHQAKELPVRLYQITRKYRDERRPRQGLLRTREFVMKDLYTFDADETAALQTYHQVKDAYAALFGELKIPYVVAEADSGSIGGNYSHEFQFVTNIGEDNIIHCSNCSYVANEELAESHRPLQNPPRTYVTSLKTADNGSTLVVIYLPAYSSSGLPTVNVHALKRAIPTLDTSAGDVSISDFTSSIESISSPRVVEAYDMALDPLSISEMTSSTTSKESIHSALPSSIQPTQLSHSTPLNLLSITPNSHCPKCHEASLHLSPAVELGHTFHLGTRYSEPLNATISSASSPSSTNPPPSTSSETPMSMGCHGIGISRTLGAVAAILKDERGLNWPRVIAPFEVVLVPGNKLARSEDLDEVYDLLVTSPPATSNPTGDNAVSAENEKMLDVVMDDRQASMVSKLKDADLIGYPVIVVLGQQWAKSRLAEVQCRRLGVKVHVALDELAGTVRGLLDRL